MKKLLFAIALMGTAHTVCALEAWHNTKAVANKAMFWKSESLTSLSFKSVFPKPIHNKSYFGVVLVGATAVGAGAFRYKASDKAW